MSEKAKGTDKFTSETVPAPEAAALIDKIASAFEMVGMEGFLGRQVTPWQMLCAVAHCIANKAHDPKYAIPLNDIAMFLYLQHKVRETVFAQMEKDIGSASVQVPIVLSDDEARTLLKIRPIMEQDAMPQDITAPLCLGCNQRHPITTKHASRIAAATVEDGAGKESLLLQLLTERSHESEGLHLIFAPSEARMFLDSMDKALSTLKQDKGN